MSKREYPTEVLDVTIQSIDSKGRGIVRYTHEPDRGSEGKKLKLIIPNVVPGDVVRVTVPNAKGRGRANVYYDELLQPGPSRNLSIPITDDISGGTPLQFMNYDAQLEYKMNRVKQNLEAIGVDAPLIHPIIGMDEPDRYRNKMEFTFGPQGELGMHEQGNYRRVIDLRDSIIAPTEMIELKQAVSRWQKEHQLQGYNKETHEGLLRHLMVRKSFATDELMVAFVAAEEPNSIAEAKSDLIERLTTQFPNLKSLLWIEDPSISEAVQEEAMYVLYGRDYINDQLNGFNYRIWYDTFFQVNPVQAEKMVQYALSVADIQSDMNVLDLFCGIGTFSLPFAAKAGQLMGIELVENSILSAQYNAQEAGLDNTFFFASDARQGLEKLKETDTLPDILMLNPPRSGAGGKLMRSIGRFGSEKILYISCNAKTLAQDLIWLKDFGYEVESVQPIDQFPHTVHVETVVLLTRREMQ